MGLRFDPIGGGQFKQAVKAIMEAESKPLETLAARKAREDAKLKLFQEFKGKFDNISKALTEVSSFKSFRDLKFDLGDGQNLVGVTLDKEKAQPGTYTIQVDSLAQRTSIISNGFEDPEDKSLGVGYVVMKMANGESRDIYVDGDSASLRGIAKAINDEADAPVRAAVVKDSTDIDEPWKLIVTGKKDGAVNAIEFPEFYFLDGEKDLFIDDTHEAKNAMVTVDGFPIELESNDMPDFMPGINLHLKQARPEQPFTLTIQEDYQKIAGKMKGLVDGLNGALEFIYKQNAIDEKTDTRNTFAGDTSLQSIEYRMRNLMHEGFPIGNPDDDGFRIMHLNELGVEFGKDGQLTFKEDKFQKLLEKDFGGISEAITGSFGFAYQLGETLKGYTQPNGLFSSREASFRRQIKDIDDQIDRKSRQLDTKQQALTEQFARLEGSLSNMQRQAQYLSATLPAGGGNNLVAQLLGG